MKHRVKTRINNLYRRPHCHFLAMGPARYKKVPIRIEAAAIADSTFHLIRRVRKPSCKLPHPTAGSGKLVGVLFLLPEGSGKPAGALFAFPEGPGKPVGALFSFPEGSGNPVGVLFWFPEGSGSAKSILFLFPRGGASVNGTLYGASTIRLLPLHAKAAFTDI